MEDKNWVGVFFLVLIVGVFLFVFVPTSQPTEPQRTDGVLVKYYWDLDDGTRVFYEGFVIRNGMSEFDLTGVCDSVTKECRKPTSQELQENKYLPQSSE